MIPKGIEPLFPAWRAGVLAAWLWDLEIQVTGLEPAIYRVKAGCHTTWLHLQKAPCWNRTSFRQICSLSPRRMVRCILCFESRSYAQKNRLSITNKRPWLNRIHQRHQGIAYDFHPLSPILNGITTIRCLQARSFCCFWHNLKVFMVVMAFLLSLISYELIIASYISVVNLLSVDKFGYHIQKSFLHWRQFT